MHRDCEVEIDVRLRRQRWQGSPSRSCSGIRSYTPQRVLFPTVGFNVLSQVELTRAGHSGTKHTQ